MYSLSCSRIMFIRRNPFTQVTSVSKYTYSSLRSSSTRVTSIVTEKKQNQQDFLKRNYASIGDRKNKNFNIPNLDFTNILNKSKQLFKEIQLSELANAPQPAFWYGISGLAPLVLPPLSFIIFGYSPFLAGAQLAFGAALCSFLAGVNWGFILEQKSKLTWETLGLAVGPVGLAWLSLLMPQTLGFVLLGGSLLTSAFLDLTTVAYPQWFRAMRLSFTIPAVICLLLTAMMSLFH